MDLTNRQIADALGCAESTVIAWCRALGLPKRCGVNDDDLRKAWQTPVSIHAMAKQLKTSEETIRKAARRLGLRDRSKGPRINIDVKLLFELWNADITRTEVAKRIGVAHSTLSVLQKRYGLPKRRKCTLVEIVDPTPDEIAERARECRERHFAQRRNERDDATRAKVSYWDARLRA